MRSVGAGGQYYRGKYSGVTICLETAFIRDPDREAEKFYRQKEGLIQFSILGGC